VHKRHLPVYYLCCPVPDDVAWFPEKQSGHKGLGLKQPLVLLVQTSYF
jgi:hypothetical protein